MSPARPTLEVGYVARVHGLKGELAVRTFDPDSEALMSVRRVVLRLRPTSGGPALFRSYSQIRTARFGKNATRRFKLRIMYDCAFKRI